MYGNVSEWVEDWDGPLPGEPAADPTGPRTGTKKIRRGGSFKYGTRCNSVFRTGSLPDHRDEEFGFRIVRDPLR
jgi:formylglycine-generating enzyme required for sulfatase activity